MDAAEHTEKLTDAFMHHPVRHVCTNPIYMSIIITGLILIIIFTIYDECHKCKTGFWIFLSVMVAVFINNQFIIKEFRMNMLSDTEKNLQNVLEAGPPTKIEGMGEIYVQPINEEGESLVVGI